MPPRYTVKEFDTLDSTNAQVLRGFAGLPDGAVVTALRQSAGRGRLDRSWLSEGKGLYFTLALKPAAPRPEVFPCYTHLLAVSVCAALAARGLRPALKWPNDVLCGGAKICGVLAEAVTSGGRLTGAAVGAGINLYQQAEDFAGLPCPAVSMAMLGAAPADRGSFLEAVLEEFFRRRPALEERGFAALSAEYRGRAGFIGQRLSVSSGGVTAEGTADVDEQGRLVLATPTHTLRFAAGDLLPLA
ncbi:MAG: biotin--[acetyl-CoA-carboxylase] ligase [Elusimicrobia bacterium HGW-Elusimicrobia-3]|jgi:BirA family biotin operon repressor/biotin-[acetyl-CoA-carboxylase] ligase|nr:MAG: biotin--[acetyl-CoA-carboxylase] ligase [Elusimicrobia bacterium HGW-Elusimicrobia-3]